MAAAASAGPGALTAQSSNIIAEHLKSPDDLTKLPALRKKLQKEHVSLEAKLKTGAKDQLEATRDGLLKLQATRRDVAGVREAFAEIEKTCGEDGKGREGGAFRRISEVSQIHRNFVQSADMLEKLTTLPGRIEAVANMLEESRQDLFSPAPHLLLLHFHISALETFRNETMQLGRTCSSDVRHTLSEYFAPLDGLIREFETYLWALGERVLDLAREGQTGVIVRLLKIVEVESRSDERAAAIRLAKKAGLEGAARFRSVVANARVIKLYRPKLLEAMDKATDELFEECWSRFGAEGGSMEFLEHLDWVYKDLADVKKSVVPLFPTDYNVFRWFVKSYHKHLGKLLRERILATDPEASALLTLYQFCQEYQKMLKKELKAEVAWLEPSLLAGREQTIIDDYLGLITRKIDEWMANLMSDEVREFVGRTNPPEEDSDGAYGLQYAAIVFQMVNQQTDLAADSGQAAILARAVAHACTAMRTSQGTWLRVLEAEFKKQREAKTPDDVTGGLVEYVIALANDQLKSADYGEALLNRIVPTVSDKYKSQIKEAIDDSINGYLDVSKRCTQVLVDLVFYDLRPALKDLFVFPNWYAEGTTTMIIETIRDYTGDYTERLNPTLFDVLCDDLIDRFLTAYIGALRRTTKLRMPAAGDRMRADTEDAIGMFSAFKSEQEVRDKFEVLQMILSLLTSSSTMVFLTYWTFAKAHGPQLSFLEALMRARDDLDKSDVSAIMESARRKVKQEGLSEVPESGPTVMSRVEQANAGGFLANLAAGAGVTVASQQPAWSALAASAGNYLGGVGRRGKE